MPEGSVIDRLRSRISSRVGVSFERRVKAPLRRRRNSSRHYRPLFVTGASGAGTSLLAVLIAQSSECAGLVYECDAQISRRSFLHVPPLSTFRSVDEYASSIAPKPSWSLLRAQDDVQNMLRSYATLPGEWVVAKGPDIHMARAHFLHRCFPETAFVAIFRDPAASIEGLRRKWRLFGDDSLAACIGFYERIHESYLKEMAVAPDRFLLVDYRVLVAEPMETVSAIRSRLGLQSSSRRLALPDAANVEGKGLRNVRGSRVGIVGDADQRARARLHAEDRAAIDAALGPLLERMRRLALLPREAAAPSSGL